MDRELWRTQFLITKIIKASWVILFILKNMFSNIKSIFKNFQK